MWYFLAAPVPPVRPETTPQGPLLQRCLMELIVPLLLLSPILSPFPLKPDTSAHVSSNGTFLRKRLEHGARAPRLFF